MKKLRLYLFAAVIVAGIFGVAQVGDDPVANASEPDPSEFNSVYAPALPVAQPGDDVRRCRQRQRAHPFQPTNIWVPRAPLVLPTDCPTWATSSDAQTATWKTERSPMPHH